MAVVLRYYFQKLTENDYKEFLKYYTRIEYSYFRDGNPTPNKEEVTKRITLAIERVNPRNISKDQYLSLMKQGDIYLYRNSNNEVIGIILVTPNKTQEMIIIHEFFVLKKYQRKHFGTRMYKDFLEELKHQDYSKIKILLMCSFEGAEEFWKKLGFYLAYSEKVPFAIDKKFYIKNERLNKS